MTEKTKTIADLYAALAAIRDDIPYMQRTDEAYGYKYIKESQVLAELLPRLSKHGLFIDQDTVSINVLDGMMTVHFKYEVRFVDSPDVCIERTQMMVHKAKSAQDMGACMTYGMRYFLSKLFSLQMDDTDPDEWRAKFSPPITIDQAKHLAVLVEADSHAQERINQYLIERGHKAGDYERIKQKDYVEMVAWLKRRQAEQRGQANG